ncbi:uncharacterized protein LOC135397590 isoform X2 [Ornithodoros turicata]
MFRTSLALFIVFWIAIYFSYGRELTFDPSATCRTDVCRAALTYSADLKSSNASLACDDFYQYACDLWNATHPSLPNVFSALEDEADRKIHGFWNKTGRANQSLLDKTATYYFSCMSALGRNVSFCINLESYLEVRGIKMRNVLDIRKLFVEATRASSDATKLRWGPPLSHTLCSSCAGYLQRSLSLLFGVSVPAIIIYQVETLDEQIRNFNQTGGNHEDFTKRQLLSHINVSTPYLVDAFKYVADRVTVLDPHVFKYAVGLLFSNEHVNVSAYFLLLKVLQDPLNSDYLVSSTPIGQRRRIAQDICRKKLQSKLLPLWNVLALDTLATKHSSKFVENTFEIVKARVTDHIRETTWLKTDIKDRLMSALLQMLISSPERQEFMGYLKYRYRRMPKLGPYFYENDWLLDEYHDSCDGNADRLCATIQDRHQDELRNNTVDLTAVHQLRPFYYAEADAYINAATLSYHMFYLIIRHLFRGANLSSVPQAKCLQDQSSRTGLSLDDVLALTTGLRLAYEVGNPEPRTPDDRIDKVTEDQLFFLRACLQFCSADARQVHRDQCNTAVRNIPQFYLAFWCPPGARLPSGGVCEVM